MAGLFVTYLATHLRHMSRLITMVELSAANSGKWPTLLKHAADARCGDRPVASPPVDKYRCTGSRSQRQKRLTSIEGDELVQAYESGLTVYELADRFGCHRTTVSGALKSHGVRMRRLPLTEEQTEEAVRLYDSGLSLAKVGERVGANAETVRQRLLERGIVLRNPHDRRPSSCPRNWLSESP